MTMTQYTPLTRDQKLQAEQIVQLGNIAEAIRSAARGEEGNNLLAQIGNLQAEVQTLTTSNTTLAQELADSNELASNLQDYIDTFTTGDITPDSVAEVLAHLNIEVGE